MSVTGGEMGDLPVVHGVVVSMAVTVAVTVAVAVTRQGLLSATGGAHVTLLRPGPHGGGRLGGVVLLHGGHGARWGSGAGALGAAYRRCRRRCGRHCCSLLLIGTAGPDEKHESAFHVICMSSFMWCICNTVNPFHFSAMS